MRRVPDLRRAFLERSSDRSYAPSFAGPVFIWDIDKTYLDTRFSSVRGLLAIPFELAVDKQALPGTVPLLRGLRHGPDDESRLSPLYFVSGSPPALRSVVERKMTLDGVQFDGITFKDQWGLIKAGRPRAVVEQVGYKLTALLLYRQELPDGAVFHCFGDDVERDLQSFLLFGEVCAGLRGDALLDRLRREGAFDEEARRVVDLAADVPVTKDPVHGVYIHEVRGGRLAPTTDPRVVIAPTFFVHALVLLQRGLLRDSDVREVLVEVRRAKRPSADDLARWVDAAVARGVDRDRADACVRAVL